MGPGSADGITVPYVSTAEFLADPLAADLTLPSEAELHQVLLTASRWCDDYVFESGSFTAHRHIEYRRTSPDRDSCLMWRPQHHPLIVLESLTCDRTTYTAPLVSLRDERTVVVNLQSAMTAWVGSLPFGVAGELYTTWVYLAGYPNTLSSGISAGDTHLQVDDAIGIVPGQSLRLATETVTVDSQWVPVDGPAEVPLVAPVQCVHARTIVSAIPRTVRDATALYAASLLADSGSAEAQQLLEMHRWG